jgi:hypothetical protein
VERVSKQNGTVSVGSVLKWRKDLIWPELTWRYVVDEHHNYVNWLDEEGNGDLLQIILKQFQGQLTISAMQYFETLHIFWQVAIA